MFGAATSHEPLQTNPLSPDFVGFPGTTAAPHTMPAVHAAAHADIQSDLRQQQQQAAAAHT
jgi:hypothetical protein